MKDMNDTNGMRNVDKKILVVEDDADCRAQIELHLQGLGFSVVSVDCCDKAREAFEKEKPHLALVDLMLENLDDGFVLCYQFKKMNSQVPIILMSAVARETGIDFGVETSEERQWIKADALLHKPFRMEVLGSEINRLMIAAGYEPVGSC